MQSLLIQDRKIFMHHLLAAETFDAFELVNAQLTTFCSYSIDGSYLKGYLPEQEDALHPSKYCSWRLLRPHIVGLVRGKSKPRSLRIVFRLSDENTQKVILSCSSSSSLSAADVNGLYLNISYSHTEEEGEKITCITGTSLKFFSLDKTLENTWDDMVSRFLRKNQIPFN